jgi:general secretion pathway protein G
MLYPDPWGNQYQYSNPGIHCDVDVYSLGADGARGGNGANSDIGNWMLDGACGG